MTDADHQEPLIVRCDECNHEWTAAYTPMQMDRMGALLRGLCCPKCGTDSDRIFIAAAKTA